MCRKEEYIRVIKLSIYNLKMNTKFYQVKGCKETESMYIY